METALSSVMKTRQPDRDLPVRVVEVLEVEVEVEGDPQVGASVQCVIS